MTYSLAPIAVFAFNRPNHLQACLKSLESNAQAKNSSLTIFVDGPRNSGDLDKVRATREIAKRDYGFASIQLEFQERNIGLANSIISGINKILEVSDSLIVIEDDLWVAPTFLSYINQGLDRYRKFPKVASIHGYNFQFENPIPEPYFLRGADCLGWATWKDRWTSMSLDSTQLLADIKLRNLENVFNLEDAYSYTLALEGEKRHGLHSWAIHWHTSMFLQDRLTLYPGYSLVQYMGADGSGTHFVMDKTHWDTELSDKSSWEFPEILEESLDARIQLIGYFRRIWPKRSLIERVLRRLKFLLVNFQYKSNNHSLRL